MDYEELKVGDLVERITVYGSGFTPGKQYKVLSKCLATNNRMANLHVECDRGDSGSWYRGNFKKISSSKSFMSSLTRKFRLLTMKEPQRTFIETGVTTDEGVLTTEGRSLFEAFMLEKHGDEFKKEVVDKIVAEDKKD